MKQVVPGVLVVIVFVGAFAAAGYAGYRFGYAQGIQVTAQDDNSPARLRPFDGFDPPGFERGFGRDGFPAIGFFPVWLLLGKFAFLALIVWFGYGPVRRSGWRLPRQTGGDTPPQNE